MLVALPSDLAEGQWVRKPESLLNKGHEYKGADPEMKNPDNYSLTWGNSLAIETQGPIYAQIASLRILMGIDKATVPKDHVRAKKYNLICKNVFEPKLFRPYLEAFSKWADVSQQQTENFLAVLIYAENDLIKNRSVPDHGSSIPHPRDL